MIMGAGVCAVALCFGLSASEVWAGDKPNAQTGAGKLTGEAFGVAEGVAGVTDKIGLTPSIGSWGTADSNNANTEIAVNAVDGATNILTGSGGSVDFGKAAVGYGKMLGNSSATMLGSTLKNIKNLNSISDLTNLKNLGNVGMSFLKDMSPEIKQLMGMAFDDLGLDSLLGGLGGGGYPVLMPTNTAQSAAAVGTSKAQTAATEGLLDAETDLTASFGPVGNMDGRMGQCSINGEDYSQPISYWLQAVGPKLEGTCPILYLNAECWPAVGAGSILGKDLKTMHQSFMAMEYVNSSGAAVDVKTKEKDLQTLYDLHTQCRAALEKDPKEAAKYTYSCDNSYWEKKFGGRRVADKSVNAVSFEELCENHVKVWADYWKQLGKSYTQLSLLHQVFVLDVSYLATPNAVKGNNMDLLPNRTPLWQGLVAGKCSEAEEVYSTQMLCVANPERCEQHKDMIRQGCSGY